MSFAAGSDVDADHAHDFVDPEDVPLRVLYKLCVFPQKNSRK